MENVSTTELPDDFLPVFDFIFFRRIDELYDAEWLYLRGVDRFFIVLGLVSNTAAGLVFFKRYRNNANSATWLLIVLSLFDWSYLLMELVKFILMDYEVLKKWPLWVQMLCHTTNTFAYNMTSWMVAVIALDRYLHICWPLKMKRLDPLQLARILTLLTAISMLLLPLTLYSVTYGMYVDDQYDNTDLIMYVFVFFLCLAFLLICLCNFLVEWKVCRRSKENLAGNVDLHKCTMMIVVMTDVFLCLKLPHLVGYVMLAMDGKPNAVIAVGKLTNCMNSSVNLFVYLASSGVFRGDFVALLKGFKRSYSENKVSGSSGRSNGHPLTNSTSSDNKA